MNLTQVAIFTHQFIIFFFAALVIGIISFVGYRIWYANYLASLPPIEIKPDVSWGVLPAPEFSTITNVSPTNFSYSVDTVTGNLPVVEKITKVFFMPKAVATLLSADRSRTIADKLKLTGEPEIISPTLYRYTDQVRQLTVDLDSGNFKYAIASVPPTIEPIEGSEAVLIQGFRNLLSSMNILTTELQNSPAKVTYLRYEGEELVPASINDAQAAEIAIWPQSVEEKSVVTTPFNQALIKALVVRSAKDPENYLSISFTFWPIDTSSFATYPVKTADQALADLKAGQGVVSIAPSNPNISLTSVYLSYFQSEGYTPYLQPIFVFEGPGFVAYVPAITAQYLTATP